MQCALMWIALCALMKELMSLLNFVGQEKLLQNGLQGLIIQMDFYIFLKEGLCFWISLASLLLYLIKCWLFTEQWVVLFLLRKPWLLGYLCSIPLCLNLRIFFSKGPQGMIETGWFCFQCFLSWAAFTYWW